MSKIPVNPGPAHWGGRHAGAFQPRGPIKALGNIRSNPVAWESEDTLSARLFVGLSVGSQPRYTLDDLIGIVRTIREEQAPEDPSVTFLAQRGVYKYKATGKTVEEDGGQVIIIDTQGMAPKAFETQMVELGESIARSLEQEMVVIEIQRRGLVEKTIGVMP
jgi:hypothetical protein